MSYQLAAGLRVAELKTGSVSQGQIIQAHLANTRANAVPIQGIISFYRAVRGLGPTLSDGTSPASFNARSLARALQYVALASPSHGLLRALYDGFCTCFVTMLDSESAEKVLELMRRTILGGRKVPKAASTEAHPGRGASPPRMVNIEVGLQYVMHCNHNLLYICVLLRMTAAMDSTMKLHELGQQPS
jgi:hypothetical protein